MKRVVFMAGNNFVSYEVIDYRGRPWFVPQWLKSTDGKTRRPRRIIAIDSFPHQLPLPGAPGDFGDAYMIDGRVPEALLTPEVPSPWPGIEVIELPDIELPGPAVLN